MRADTTMRAAVLEGFGPPECYVTRRLPIPVPGDSEALVRVHACGICGEEILARRGDIPSYARLLLMIQGHELVGEVVLVGAAVADVAPGDVVVVPQVRPCHQCEFCRSGRETVCIKPIIYGTNIPGGYCEYCLVNGADVVRVPANVDRSAASLAGCAIAVGVHALRRAHLQAGQRLLVTGAGGGVGVHALQVGRSYGAHTIAVTSCDQNRAQLDKFADEVVGVADFADELRRRHIQPDIVMELTSGITFEQSIRGVARGGTIVLVGNVTPRPVELLPGAMILRETAVLGSSGATRPDFVEAVRLLSEGNVEPVIARILPMDRLADAHREVESGSGVGRVVITHGSKSDGGHAVTS